MCSLITTIIIADISMTINTVIITITSTNGVREDFTVKEIIEVLKDIQGFLRCPPGRNAS